MLCHSYFLSNGVFNIDKLEFLNTKTKYIMTKAQLILFSLLFAVISLSVNAQQQKVTLSYQNTRFEEVLNAIKQQTKLTPIFSEQLLDINRKVSIKVSDAPITTALKQLLNGTNIDFEIKNNKLYFIEKVEVSKKIISTDRKKIVGTVYEPDGTPVIGASIAVKNTSTTTVTDTNGKFSLNIPTNSILVVSYIGMLTQEVSVNNQSELMIRLKADEKTLDEVVFVGYGTVRKGDLTGSVSSVKISEEAKAQYTSVDQLLQGKVSGLSVLTGTEGPGSFASLRIRGGSSITGDNEPLYVIDGIPQSPVSEQAKDPLGSAAGVQVTQNPLISLNPQDIESVEILKDASATAIYGSRASNGVILITTKQATKGNTKIALNINTDIGEPANKLEMLNLRDYVEHHRSWHTSEATQRFFIAGDEIRAVPEGQGGSYNPNNPNTYFVITNKNWQDVFYKRGFSKNYGASVNGGIGNKTNYYLSLGYKDVEGIVAKANMEQVNYRLNMKSELSRKLSLELILSGSKGKLKAMQNGDLLRGSSTGSATRSMLDFPPYEMYYQDADLLVITPITGWLNDYDDFTNTSTYTNSISLKYNISKTLNYRARFSNDVQTTERNRWFGLSIYEGRNKNGVIGSSEFTRNNYFIESMLSYDKRFSKKFNLNGVLGFTYDDYNSLNKTYSGYNFDIYDLRSNGLYLANTLNLQTPGQKASQILSFLGRANMRFFGGKYLATVSFRADGTSKFKDNWGYFPSTALAWNINQEPFMKGLRAIDQLKLRLGWGQTGNQNIAPYSGINSYDITNNSYATTAGEKILAASLSRIVNENLRWETTETFNAGLDFGFFKQRISGTIDLYKKRTKDLLITQNIPPSNGFPDMVINYGTLENKGLEISLNGDAIRKKDLTINIGGNIAFNRGKVLDMGYQPAQWGNHILKAFPGNKLGESFYVDPANIYAVGYQPGLFWGYVTKGIIKDMEDLAYIDANGNKQYTVYNTVVAEVGNYKFEDLNHDGIIDDRDKTFIGNPNPKFTYGFQININYKQFSLSTVFNGVYGNNIMNANRYTEFYPGQLSNFNIRKEAYDNMWSPTTNPNGIYPGISAKNNIRKITNILIEDGSFLRLNDITLAYQLPDKIVKKRGINRVSIFATGKNLFVLNNYQGYDPEVGSLRATGLRQGIDWNSFARARTYTFGLSANF